MIAALAELSESAGREPWRTVILPRLATEPTDEYRFLQESDAPTGLIPWRRGEELIHSARAMLSAGAKSYLTPLRYFSNRGGRFANRYLDNVLMGQTAASSYIITAYVPVQASVQLKGTQEEGFGIDGMDVASTRSITTFVASALLAAEEAISHYNTQNTYSAFEDGAIRGISYELVRAIQALVSDADEASVAIDFDPLQPVDGLPTTATVDFSRQDEPVLEAAALRLFEKEAPRIETLIGWVHLLTKKDAGGPGVVGITTIGSQLPKKARVRLSSPEHYHMAVRAHDEDLLVQVTGRLVREGTLSWLYRAKVDMVLGSEESMRMRTVLGVTNERVNDVELPNLDS